VQRHCNFVVGLGVARQLERMPQRFIGAEWLAEVELILAGNRSARAKRAGLPTRSRRATPSAGHARAASRSPVNLRA
jgi:hypothetical protein